VFDSIALDVGEGLLEEERNLHLSLFLQLLDISQDSSYVSMVFKHLLVVRQALDGRTAAHFKAN